MHLRRLFQLSEDSSIQAILFSEILFISLIISLINIITNIVIDFPFNANYKWFFMIVLNVWMAKNHQKNQWIPFSYIFFIITVLLPLGWYISGYENNNVIAYVFLIIIAITFLFDKTKRFILASLTILIFLTFIVIEFNRPDLLIHYEAGLVFKDRMIQMTMAMFGTYFMLRQFSNAYHKNNLILREQSAILSKMAYTDPLTGIYNRAFIFQEYDQAIQNHKPFVTVMMDIDDFKHINDDFGHLVGDQILESMGNLLDAHFGDSGYVARYGGDEFLVLLFMEMEMVSFKLELFKEAFLNLPLVLQMDVTISAGYAPYISGPLNNHLREVDEVLYRAKHEGKNRILRFNPELQERDA